MRWPKMSIHRTMLLYHVLVSFFALVSVGYLWISAERSRFVAEEQFLRASYLEDRKDLLKLEVDQAVDFVRHMQSQTEMRLKENIKNRVYEAYDIADNLYKEHKRTKSTEEIKKIIKDALRPVRFSYNRGYYFAFDMNGTETLFAAKPEMEGKNMLEVRGGQGEPVVADMLSLVKEKGESFYTYTWSKPGSKGYYPKIAFMKVFKPIGWVFGTGEYIKDVEEDIQKECITWISSIRFSKDGYVFVGQYDGLSLSGPQTGKNMIHVEDVNGVKVVQKLIKAAKSGGGYINYVLPGFEGMKQAPKMSYAVGLDDWQWYIGSGLYVDEIENEIIQREKELKQRIKGTILTISLILLSLLGLMFFLYTVFSIRIQKNLKLFAHFFYCASSNSIKIDENELHYTEFMQLAQSANHMIDERRRAEQALSTSHELFLTVLDSIDATIYVADMETYEILFMNKHMRDAYDGDLTGEICWKSFRNGEKPCSNCTNQQLVDKNGKSTGVHVWQGKNSRTGKWFINYDRAIEWIDGRLVRLQIATDITHLKKMEEDLLQARKMEAVGHLAGGVAHEFNNVLAIIIGNVELMLGDVDKHAPLQKNVSEILSASLRARDVVKQLLNFSRKSGSEKKSVDIRVLLKEALKLLKASIPSNIEVRENIPLMVDAVMVDSTQIHQLLINLCNNASQAMGAEGGILTIELENVVVDEKKSLELMDLKPGNYVRISVGDTGTGIPREMIDKIFDPYFTTKDVGKGTGMGLAVVHGIVKDHQGAIHVDSTFGEGAVFHVYLPSTHEIVFQELKLDQKSPRGKENIIFLDDEELIVDIGSSMLQRMGYSVVTETDPLRVLAYVKSHPNDVDLVISDMTMPNLTGDKLAEELLKIRPDIPIIVCTGYSEKMSPEKAKKMGIKHVMMKPVGMKELGNAVRKTLDERAGKNPW